jgi:hypothetical protein
LLDPEVQTLTSLTNVQNSLFIPNLGRIINRRPTYLLVRDKTSGEDEEERVGASQPASPRSGGSSHARRTDTITRIDSDLSDSRYAVLPPDTYLDGWSKEDLTELNDYVRHMLHSRRSKFKRAMKGFKQYVSRRRCLTIFPYLDRILQTNISSAGLPCYLVRDSDYTLRSCVGSLSHRYVCIKLHCFTSILMLYRLDQRGREAAVYDQRYRLCPCGIICCRR